MSRASDIATVAMEGPLPEKVEDTKMTSISLRSKSEGDTSYGRNFLLENDFMYIDDDGDEVDSGYGTNRILFDTEQNATVHDPKNSTNSTNLSHQKRPAKSQEKENAEEERTKGMRSIRNQ